MRLFWQRDRKRRSTIRFKTSAISNARFPESYSNAECRRTGNDVRVRTATKNGSRPSAAFDFTQLDLKSVGGVHRVTDLGKKSRCGLWTLSCDCAPHN